MGAVGADRETLDERFMASALEQAGHAERNGEVPVGAVVVIDDEIVGRGFNSPIRLADPTAHAEILALRDAAAARGNYRIVAATLYCTVEPCVMCIGAALHARIGRLVYGAADPKVGASAAIETLRQGGAGFNHRFETRSGVLAEKATLLLTRFFRDRRRPPQTDGEDSG